jgi:predicted alpha/beta-fold hydrolase
MTAVVSHRAADQKFRRHPLILGGHLQTLAGAWWPFAGAVTTSRLHLVDLPDGDRIALHEDRPAAGTETGLVALLIHGLCGCHGSPYMARIARKLIAAGVVTYRMDLRGCGAGNGHARWPYHAGRWQDAQAAAKFILGREPGARLTLAGFSLGGSLVLNWLGVAPEETALCVHRAVAICPPVDLAACSRNLARSALGAYDRHFARLLYRQVRQGRQWHADSPLAKHGRAPRGVFEFDDLYTAPLADFGGAAHYYEIASASRHCHRIDVPTLILGAADDPLIPPETLSTLPSTAAVTVRVERSGGHLGFLASRRTADPDRHWMDWRIIEWLTARHG